MIRIDRVTVRSGSFSLGEVSLTVPTGRYAVLMGATGSGKTTLLEGICGLKPVIAGRILLDDRDVTCLRPAERGVGYVPQDGALFSRLSVREHFAFALKLRRWPRERIAERVLELARLLGIEAHLSRLPGTLSGGEKQRVALGRALSFRPALILLDEPLSALDAATRGSMMELLKRIQAHERATLLHVTHNRDEAERLGDLHLRLEEGRVETVP